MYEIKKAYSLIKYKKIFSLLVFLFLSISFSLGQNAYNQDSLVLDAIPSVEVTVVDSSYNYLLDSLPTSYYLDSLRSMLLVTDNDFVGWINRMNLLHADESKELFTPIPKVGRPAWLIVVILLLFSAIGVIRIFFYNNFHTIINGFYDTRVVLQLNKEDNIGTSWPYIFIYIVFTLSLGLFVSLFQSYYFQHKAIEFLGFLQISVVIALLFLIKIVVIRILGVLFDVERMSREYVVFIYLFYFNSVLLLMPLTLMMIFLPIFYYEFILYFFVIIAVILFLFRFLTTVYNLIGNLQFSIFYLILYLCTLEIAPILILVKSLNN